MQWARWRGGKSSDVGHKDFMVVYLNPSPAPPYQGGEYPNIVSFSIRSTPPFSKGGWEGLLTVILLFFDFSQSFAIDT